jgi:hypothetical protein
MVDDIAGLGDEVGEAPGCEDALADDLGWGLGMIAAVLPRTFGCRTRRRAQLGQAALGTPTNPLKALSGQLADLRRSALDQFSSLFSSVSLRWSTAVSTSSNSHWLTPAKTV